MKQMIKTRRYGLDMKKTFFRLYLKILSIISPSIAATILFRLFKTVSVTPPRKLEETVLKDATIEELNVNMKKVVIYRWRGGGEGKPVLLVHGWNSRASRFYLMIRELLKNGYPVISFDAPGHGESEGNSTSILEYNEIMQQLYNKYGIFSAIIAHSLGVTCAFYALKKGVIAEKIIAISGVCEFEYLPYNFSRDLNLTQQVFKCFKRKIEQFFYPIPNIWEFFSANYEPQKINSTRLIIHDKHDMHVDIEQSQRIYQAYVDRAITYFTNNLGHFQILTDMEVINRSIEYVNG